MKSAKLLNLLMAGVLLATFAAGCKKQPKNITAIPGRDAQIRNGGLNPPIDPTFALPRTGVDGEPLSPTDIAPPLEGGNQDRVTLAGETIYFGFDRSAIQPNEQPKLDRVATVLKSTDGVQLLVEGHCDERGTEEYNRALGERRAIAAREYLIQKHGIGSHRITTASFGEDRPVELGTTEEAYARNRRAEFVLLRP